MQERRIRAWGPYKHGNQWRVILSDEGGGRDSRLYRSKAEAEQVVAEAGRRCGHTVDQAIDAYELAMKDKGNKPKSAVTTATRLRGFFAGALRGKLRTLSKDACEAAYDAYSSTRAVDTHRNTLAEAKTFARWCVAQGWLKASPIEGVAGRGRRRRGKEQLRIDEARLWAASAFQFAQEGHDGALAALVALTMGLRSSEILGLQVRDLDDDASLVVVTEAKTSAGRRRVRVSALVRDLLRARAEGRAPTDRLFGIGRRETVRRWVIRICAAAGVPHVTTHGLRGVFASLLQDEVAAVSRMLGHADAKVTLGHYVAPDALQAGLSERMDAVLARRRPGPGN